MKVKQKHNILVLITVFSFCLGVVNLNIDLDQAATQSLFRQTLHTQATDILVGSFFRNLTSAQEFLFEELIFGTAIGETWNVTLALHSNSTTAINLTFYNNIIPMLWEGPPQFIVQPGKNITVSYVLHGVSDERSDFNFYCTLVESNKNASGTYKIEKIHPGYATNVGTSSIYVSNITAWLERLSSTSVPSSTATSGFIGFFPLIVVSVIQLLYRRLNHTKNPSKLETK